MKRKMIAGLLIIAMLFTCVPAVALADASGDGYSFDSSTGQLTISSKEGTRAWRNDSNIVKSDVESVIITNDVTVIDYNAFDGCISLTSITIPNSVTKIGSNAFKGCTSLKGITISNSVTEIGSNAFDGCISLTGINIPNSVTEIGSNAFKGCTSLASITIPDSVTEIGNNAFEDCTSLKGITISNSVTEIGNYTFHNCTSLASIAIPDSVTIIGFNAFDGCISLTGITIPNSVTTIAGEAFNNCRSLTSITIPADINILNKTAFDGCRLNEIIFLGTVPSGFTHDKMMCKVEVVNGTTTSGKYVKLGESISITADTAPAGQHFKAWTTTSSGVVFAATNSESTTFTMPGESVTVTANYEAHNYSKATCLAPKTCSVCNATEGEKDIANHASADFTYTSNNDGTHKKVHACCGAEAEETCSYDSNNVCVNCGYTKPTTSPSTSTGGGFSGNYNYPVSIADADSAAVTLSDNYAIEGETVTITVMPDAGKQVDEVTVTDKDGEVIPVTKTGDNTYTFTMPEGKVNVSVTTEAIDYDTKVVLQIGNKNVVVNGKAFTNDVAAQLVGDRTLVPIRVIVEALGGEVDWNEAIRTVTITIDGKVLTLVIDETIPGFGQGATIMDSRTYVPIRYVAEYIGAYVEWLEATQQVVIMK